MVIIQVAGGLGNQLQQYALYRKFLSLGKEAKLDLSWFGNKNIGENGITTSRRLELDYLEGISYTACTEQEKRALTGSTGIGGKLRRNLLPFTVHQFQESAIYHPDIFEKENCYISGYFACEKYYADILATLRDEIRFPKSGNPANEKLAREMKECPSVSVHIRRGDYKNPENAAMFGNICTESYYEGALAHMKRRVKNARFYLFSDDVNYVREHFEGAEYTVVDVNRGADSFYDMWLMSQCRHNICANSTFSFWGARLNRNEDKIMIRPTIHKNSQKFVKEEMEELWKGWTFVDPDGNIYGPADRKS